MVDLELLEKLEKAATPGPWEPVRSLTCGHLRAAHNYRGPEPEKEWTNDDLALIAAARNALPALITELRGLEGKGRSGTSRYETCASAH